MSWRTSIVMIAVVAAWMATAAAAATMEFTGRVVDARTGAPVAGARVHGGFPGRGGIGAVTTGADGSFRVVYPEDTAKDLEYYALIVEPKTVVEKDEWDTKPDLIGEPAYQNYIAHYDRPQAVGDVRVVPRHALVKGRIVDASTGAAISGARVWAFMPGAVIHATQTDGNGVYRLRIDVYQGWNTSVETTPAGHRPPESSGWYQPMKLIGMEASAQGYSNVQVNPVQEGGNRVKVDLEFTSSLTGELFTGVDVRLPKRGSGVAIGPDLVTVTAPGAPPAAAGGDVDLKAVVRDLNTLMAQHRQAVVKARKDGKLPCNQEILAELKRIRGLLEQMGGKSQSYQPGQM